MNTINLSSMAKRFRVDSSYLSVPPTAWPTVILFVVALGVYLAPILLYCTNGVSTWWTLAPSSAAVFILFTPLHDAAHRSVSRQYRWLNEGVGWICGLIFIAAFPAFRYVHFQHHKFTNHPEKDPDYWSGAGAVLIRPLRWVLQSIHYYIPVFKAAQAGVLSRREAAVIFSTLLLFIATMVILSFKGYGREVLRLWMVPVHTASAFLAYTFDYIPHRPHHLQRKDDIYKCTNKIDGLLAPNGIDLSIPLLYQTYHNIHHLYPRIPFYRYIRIWQKYRNDLLERGTPIVPAYDHSTPWL